MRSRVWRDTNPDSTRRWPAPGRVAAFGALLLAPAVFLAPASWGQSAPAPSNVLLITVEATRADRLGCYGDSKARTPNLDALAARGVLFEAAYTSAVATLPANVTILTGLLPPAHGVRADARYRLRPEIDTLPEILKAARFRTIAVLGSGLLDSSSGLDQGMDIYDDLVPEEEPPGLGPSERTAAEVTDAALAHLSRQKNVRWFLWAHYADPHFPYDPPSPHKEDHPKGPYGGEVAYVDSEIGRLLAGIASGGAADKTLVVVASDHGEGMREHGERGHGVFLYDETTRIPLIIAGPAPWSAPRRVGSVVRTADILPTIADLLGLPHGGRVDGVSLRPLLEGRSQDLDLAAFSESTLPYLGFGWSPLASLRAGRWKYIQAPKPEIYDLEADPSERKNRIGARKEEAGRMRERLETLLRDSAAPGEDLAALRRPGPAIRRGGAAEAITFDPFLVLKGGEMGLPDPKDRAQALDRIARIEEAGAARKFPAAISEAQAVLKTEPDSALVRERLADAYRAQGRTDEAVSEYRSVLEVDPRNTGVMMKIGWIQLRSGNLDGAKAAYDAVLRIRPDDADAFAALGRVASLKGDNAAAETAYRNAISQEPENLRNLFALAEALERQGGSKLEEAAQFYDRVAALNPADPRPLVSLGRLFFRMNRYHAAMNVAEKLTSMMPDVAEPYFYLGDCQYMLGQLREAEEAYRKGIALAQGAPQGYYGMGLVALKNGDVAGARRWFEEALRVNPAFAAAAEELKKLPQDGAKGP